MFELKYWERTRCDCCREWIEPGFGARVNDKEFGKVYHWNCYWAIIWPQKAKASRTLKAQRR